jgi:hypothetical protein
MPKYNYGKTFKKNGRLVRYRYTGRKKSTKTLVYKSNNKVVRKGRK